MTLLCFNVFRMLCDNSGVRFRSGTDFLFDRHIQGCLLDRLLIIMQPGLRYRRQEVGESDRLSPPSVDVRV